MRPLVVLHQEPRAAAKLAAFTHSRDPVDRRRQHGLRGRRHPAAARRRLRDRRQDAARVPPDRRPVRAHDQGPPAGAELALHPGRSDPPRSCRDGRAGAAACAAAPERGRRGVRARARRAARDRARRDARVRAAERRCRAADDAVRLAGSGDRLAAARGRPRPPSQTTTTASSRRRRHSSAGRCCAASATGSCPS